MLGIPLLSTYIQRIVKQQCVADSVDWLNYFCSARLLAFFALAISAKQYFGSPIQCWTPNEFKGSWERYAEDYCFVAHSYYVPLDEEVPRSVADRHDQISYYRWVPVALAVQALLFWLPSWLWNISHKQTAINPRAVLNEASKSRALFGNEREKEIQGMAAFVSDTLAVFSEERPHHPSGMNATLIYLAIKLLYLLNCCAQLIVLNRFLGGQYHIWAWESLLTLLRGQEWAESAVFPRVIMCDFSIRRLANHQQHTVQCVLMLNLINEKLYFFLHFWFLLVGTVTFVNFAYYLAMLMLPSLRTQFIKRNINKAQQKRYGFGSQQLHGFVQSRLRPDGVLLIHFLRQHVGGRITYDLLNEMLRLHWLAQTAGTGSSGNDFGGGETSSGQLTSKMSNASSSPAGSEKALLFSQSKNGRKEEKQPTPRLESYSRQNTYKSTPYGPGGLVCPLPRMNEQQPSAPPPFSPASLLRAISGSCSPTLANGGNPYTAPPALDFIDGFSGGQQQQKNGSESPPMSTTPLMQSRRAKSPLVTGLGSIGRRQSGFGLKSTGSREEDAEAEECFLNPSMDGEKSSTNGSSKTNNNESIV